MALAVPLAMWVVALAAFISGITGQIFGVFGTQLQQKVPANMLSRVSAYDHLSALAPLGIVLFGLLYENVGHQLTLTIAALVVIVPTLLVFTVQDVRRMTIEYEPPVNGGEPAATSKPHCLRPPQSILGVFWITSVIGRRIKLRQIFLQKLAGMRPSLSSPTDHRRTHQRLGTLEIDLVHCDHDHCARELDV